MNASPQTWRVKLVTQRLDEGAVIAYPTEGVWGLGCLPSSLEAVSRILQLKQRSWEQGLILVAGQISEAEPYLFGISASERKELEDAWPGPVTFLVPDNGTAQEWIKGKHDRVAIRVSAHPIIKAICREVGGPIVSTSANPGRKPAARDELRVRKYFPEGIDYIFPGKTGGYQGASEIRELGTGRVMRAAMEQKS